MLASIAPVDDHAEASTAVASSPAVNSLRISRSALDTRWQVETDSQKPAGLPDHAGRGDELNLGNEDAYRLTQFW